MRNKNKQKRTKKDRRKICTIYEPSNPTIMQTIKAAYEHMNLKNDDGSRLSLGKFILVHAMRDISRMMEMAAAAMQENLGERENAEIEQEMSNDNNIDNGENIDE